jgi:hypothetical protein
MRRKVVNSRCAETGGCIFLIQIYGTALAGGVANVTNVTTIFEF